MAVISHFIKTVLCVQVQNIYVSDTLKCNSILDNYLFTCYFNYVIELNLILFHIYIDKITLSVCTDLNEICHRNPLILEEEHRLHFPLVTNIPGKR